QERSGEVELSRFGQNVIELPGGALRRGENGVVGKIPVHRESPWSGAALQANASGGMAVAIASELQQIARARVASTRSARSSLIFMTASSWCQAGAADAALLAAYRGSVRGTERGNWRGNAVLLDYQGEGDRDRRTGPDSDRADRALARRRGRRASLLAQNPRLARLPRRDRSARAPRAPDPAVVGAARRPAGGAALEPVEAAPVGRRRRPLPARSGPRDRPSRLRASEHRLARSARGRGRRRAQAAGRAARTGARRGGRDHGRARPAGLRNLPCPV